MWPSAHRCSDAALPAAQTKPGAQSPAGAVNPVALHTLPAMHGTHASMLVDPDVGLKVPLAHAVPAVLPVPHHDPAGHASPITPQAALIWPLGVAVQLPPLQ
jgi:hypothetical protein